MRNVPFEPPPGADFVDVASHVEGLAGAALMVLTATISFIEPWSMADRLGDFLVEVPDHPVATYRPARHFEGVHNGIGCGPVESTLIECGYWEDGDFVVDVLYADQEYEHPNPHAVCIDSFYSKDWNVPAGTRITYRNFRH